MTWGFHPMTGMAAYIFIGIVGVILIIGLYGMWLEKRINKDNQK